MSHHTLLLFLALSVCMYGPGAVAASKSGQFAVKGIGHDRCNEFIKARSAKSSAYRYYSHYIAGYLTAANRFITDTVDITSWETVDIVAAYVENLCRIKPDVLVVEAMEGVFSILMPHRLRSDAELVEVSAAGKSMKVYASVIIRVKQSLIERKLYTGAINAKFDSLTAQALIAFQKEKNIPQTGLPDQQSLYLLFGQSLVNGN